MADISLPVHESFDASDSDITIQSSDNVLFKLHIKYLVATSGIFLGSEIETRGEVVHLEEQANVLEIVFQFIYPRVHPVLEGMEFELIKAIAEAVEKYQIFSAMFVCQTRLRETIPLHAIDVLLHGLMHDYDSLINESALRLVRSDVIQVAERLPNHYIVPWLKYHRTAKNHYSTECWKRSITKSDMTAAEIKEIPYAIYAVIR
ncbi:hypothetical protein CPB84DRAFT_1966756 [Gymnopilus junonius]|uniref:BTB domain-containing protein n=1 Tax=Gymnopilus junonius TaxID=109634 RepID=A0A9P5TGM5_GYMJU|nr:hypothetical protein CPB84DRAFT_1966756 [Gymnopilus junonius]